MVASPHPVSKLNLGSDDPSKPLLAVIIDRLSSGAAPKAASIGIEGTGTTSNARLAKDREAIDSAISDLKKPEDRSKDLIQQAKESPSLSQQAAGHALGREQPKESSKDSEKQLKAADTKKEAPKMMGAKKETEGSAGQDEKKKTEKSEDSLPGRKFQNIPEDAMKKKAGVVDRDDGRCQ